MHRQDRTFLPAVNPLAPSADPEQPSEVPEGEWEVAVFENRFPTFSAHASDAPALEIPTAPASGVCEVVVFTQDPTASLGFLPLERIQLILDVWADRFTTLGALPFVQYVFPFENRGVEVGVTLHHAHGQIYAYPFIPPIAERELQHQRAYLERHGRGLLEVVIASEMREGTRVLHAGADAVAFMPAFARYAYEVWVAPLRPAPSLADLDGEERGALARALKVVLLQLDGLWDRPMPYILAIHQAPTDGAPHPEAHVHIEIYPALRQPERLKYLAGSEVGAGVFTADSVPEEKAAELRAVNIALDT